MYQQHATASASTPLLESAVAYYSFDFAQVHFPSDQLQPVSVYFLTPRKCAVFGDCCEAVPQVG